VPAQVEQRIVFVPKQPQQRACSSRPKTSFPVATMPAPVQIGQTA
jgi:hypothetical protein